MAVVAVEVNAVILGIKLAITVIITHVFAEVVGEDIICFVIAGYIVVEAIGIDDRYEIQFGLVYDLSDHGILLIVFEEIPHVVDVCADADKLAGVMQSVVQDFRLVFVDFGVV